MHVGQMRLVQEASSQELLAKAKPSSDTISLGHGVPFFRPPDQVADALFGALGDDFLILVPYYLNHIMAIQLTDCNSIIIPTDEEV